MGMMPTLLMKNENKGPKNGSNAFNNFVETIIEKLT